MTALTYDAARALASRAERLKGERGGLPALFAFSDPKRTPNLFNFISCLPPGCGFVLRTFGHYEIQAQAFGLAEIARDKGLTFLIAADPDLAERCGADGVHWPEAQLSQTKKSINFKIITSSAHSPAAVRRASGRVDAIFVSTAFTSHSPSAKRPLGPFRLNAYAKRSQTPVYALGGITPKTVKRLSGLGVSGAAAIEALYTVKA